MYLPKDRLYTENHLWVKKEKKKLAKIGITEYFSFKEAEIIDVTLPEEGEEYGKGDIFGSLESIEEEINLIMPVSGVVTTVNEKVLEDVDILNEDPYEEGWLIKLEMTEPSELEELLSPEDYEYELGKEFEEEIIETPLEEEE